MNENDPFMSMEAPCEQAVTAVIQQMSRAGISVLRTFDLQAARLPQTDCPCPHHGTAQCDCQLVILLVYVGDSNPVSLIAHGYEGKTWFSVVNASQKNADTDLFAFIQQTLAPSASPGSDSSMMYHGT
jgi:hypothetical protein